MGKHTPLYDVHVQAGAKMVDFGGWDMPIHYGSQVKEHDNVRTHAGIFDVSHMTVVDLSGERVAEFASLHDGMGRLTFTPEPGRRYTAHLTAPAGIGTAYALPRAQRAAVPVVAPSANRSGKPPAKTAQEVADTLGDDLDLVRHARPGSGDG